jgi:uncharacterized membrane protein YdjX (TVP38/TMEM64 family)
MQYTNYSLILFRTSLPKIFFYVLGTDSIELATETALVFKLVHPEEEVRQNQAYKAGIKAKVLT